MNTYGTPRYREANPGAFCCILFPYLFGIMFGDFGHGILLALFGVWLINQEKVWEGKKLSDMLEMVYGGRYILLLNGLFGAFVGICYNEAFAYPMAFFGPSHWKGADATRAVGDEVCTPEDDHCELVGGNYPWGVDPIWHYTGNKITFFNSLKMKISIVVGVIQMTLGICLSLLNHLEYRDYKKVLFQFIPEMTFFMGIFGYLVFCILFKWSIDWNAGCGNDSGDFCEPAPSLLTLLINMFMSPSADIDVPLYGHQCFTDCSAAASFCGTISLIDAACPATCGTAVDAAHSNDTLHPTDSFGVETKVSSGVLNLCSRPRPRTCFTAQRALLICAPSHLCTYSRQQVCFSQLQSQIQNVLLVAALVAVPLLLLPIPFIELFQANQAKQKVWT